MRPVKGLWQARLVKCQRPKSLQIQSAKGFPKALSTAEAPARIVGTMSVSEDLIGRSADNPLFVFEAHLLESSVDQG